MGIRRRGRFGGRFFLEWYTFFCHAASVFVLPHAAREAPVVASACCIFQRCVGVSCVLLCIIY
jgi:hypothetical protein